jgi:hypothetical protein
MILLFLCALVFAQPQVSYDAGVAALRSDNPVQAELDFKSAIKEGALSVHVYHGLGNALYRQGRVGEAAAAWMRGLELSPNDKDLKYNMSQIHASTSNVPQFFRLPLSAFQLGLIVSFLLSLSLFSFICRPQVKWPIVSAVVISAVVLFMGRARLLPNADAVVVSDSVLATSMPDGLGVELFVIQAGLDVRLLESSKESYRIELSNGDRGWISRQSLISLDPSSPFELK